MSPFIETERIILNPITEVDFTKTHLSWLNDQEVNQYLESGFFKHTMKSLLQLVREQKEK